MSGNRHNQWQCGPDCHRLCCTKIEHFGVVLGNTPVLNDVNIHIHCGELTALIGPNGAGKSTLLKAVLGEVKHSGELKYVDAKGVRSGNPLIGYVPQYLNFDLGTPTSVRDLFVASVSKIPAWLTGPRILRDRVAKSLSRVKGEQLIDKRLGMLSGGELQRVLLALALDPIPDLLLLDEPVSGIDQPGLDLFYDLVSELRENYDLSIILISHDLDMVARYADRVVLLAEGKVIGSGSPERVFGDERTAEVFGRRRAVKNPLQNEEKFR